MTTALEHARGAAEVARLKAEKAMSDLRALHARGQQKILGDYTAARKNRTRSGGGSSRGARSTSADAQLDQMTLSELRAVSQRLMRNNTLVNSMVRRRVDRVVGSGPTLEVQTADAKWNDAAEAWWAWWCREFADIRGMRTFNHLLRDAYQAMLVDGDVGFIRVAAKGDGGQGFKTGLSGEPITPAVVGSLQAIEAERLRTPLGQGAVVANRGIAGGTSGSGEATIIAGIECDAQGRPLYYHVTDWTWSGMTVAMTTTPVPAGEFLFLVGGGGVKLNQTRGEPRLARLAELMGHAGEYLSATVQTARAGACQAGIIKSNSPADAQAARLGEDVVRAEDGQTERRLELQPLAFTFLAPGESFEAFKPEVPTQNFDAFMRMIIRIAANDLDQPLEMALLDHSTSTAYAGRTGFITVKPTIDVDRAVLAQRLADRVKTWVIGMGIAAGALEFREDWDRHMWVWPPDPTFEIDKEYATLASQLDHGHITNEEICQRYGRDFAAVVAKLAAERAMAAGAGAGVGEAQIAKAPNGQMAK